MASMMIMWPTFVLFAIAVFMLTFFSAKINNVKSSLLFPVEGDIIRDGTFYTTVYIGNPPKAYKLDVDTGSNITWVQCKATPDTKLPKAPNAPYQPNNVMLCKDPLCSFISQPTNYPCQAPDDQCDYEVEYADHSSSLGVMVRDDFTMKFADGSNYKSTLAFGCGYDQIFSSASALIDGVLGLAYGEASIVSQLINLGATKNVIGHCLGRQGKGFLFIGEDLLPEELIWAPLVPNSANSYLLGPVDLISGKVSIAKGVDVIFDSGSTYTYLNAQIYRATLSLIRSGMGKKPLSAASDRSLPVCWKSSEPFNSIDEVKKYFSPLVFSFTKAKNVAFALQPEAYLVISSHGNVCLGILNGTEANLGTSNVIGDVSFFDKLVVYDNERRRIGWTSWNCNEDPKH